MSHKVIHSSPVKSWSFFDGLSAENTIALWQEARRKYTEEMHLIEQILGQVLGYPWYKDDQENFPGATEAEGVCLGPHTAATLASEAATLIETLRETIRRLELDKQ